ncbi:MAG: L,D-transpeptidase family protein [Methylococcaceae bacterium]|nr:L,D-transpeptidase family protein [Methylococcaceae bacterium]
MLDFKTLFFTTSPLGINPRGGSALTGAGCVRAIFYSALLWAVPAASVFAENPLPLATPPVAATVTTEYKDVTAAIQAVIAAKQNPLLHNPDFQYRADDLDALYRQSGYQLLWLGQPLAAQNITEVLNLFANAGQDGLVSARYDKDVLQQKLAEALLIPANAYQALAAYDTAISVALLRFLHDLHYGRIDPHAINFHLKLRGHKLIDLPDLIATHLRQGQLAKLPEAVAPKLKQYQRLKLALARYRALASNTAPWTLTANKVKPGGSLPQAAELARFLIAVGDLPDTANTQPERYHAELVAGVKSFQLRHGMNADGVLGKTTVAAINTPLAVRVQQIELAMERLRWLPETNAGASIIVNIPAFQLWAFDDVDEFNTDMPNMRVVVGKALENQTPVLMAKMSFIDFMPYWNVPYNIVKEEILPKLLKDPGYLESQNMELVSTFSNESKAVGFSGSTIARLKQGTLRIRQRPGKKNALGKVKFIFPNKSDVYLHDTPSRSLFSKSRRDFSHGCVRVANPDLLAEFALKDQWSKATIQEALNTPKTRRVVLKKSIPVLFFYMTSFIDQHDKVAFYADVYDYDEVLKAALEKAGDVSDLAIFVQPPVLKPFVAIKVLDFIKPIVPIKVQQPL